MSFKKGILNFHNWLTVSPTSIQGEEKSSHAILAYSAFCGGLAHFFFIFLFYFTGIKILFILNIGSVLLFILALHLLRTTGSHVSVIFLCVFEVVGHSYFATWILGWDSSFHYYILLFIGVLPLALFTWKSRFYGIIFILSTYIFLYVISNVIWNFKREPSEFNSFYNIMNQSIFILVMGTASSYLGWLTQQSRADLFSVAMYNSYLYLDSYSSRQELEESYKKIESAYHELKRTQEQLLEAERLASLGQLVGGISHELNNPISVIQANSELLRSVLREILIEIPGFLNSLENKEREFFYEIVEKSVKNKEFLNSRDERKRKKELHLEIRKRIADEELSFALAEKFLSLRLPVTHSAYFDYLEPTRLLEFLQKAQIFKSQATFLMNIEIAIEKASRVVFSLRSYLNVETYNQKKEVNLGNEIEKALHLYDNYIVGKIHVQRDYSNQFLYSCVAENFFQVWKNLIFNAIQATESEKKIVIKIYQSETIPQEILSSNSSRSNSENILNGIKSWILISIQDFGSGIPLSSHDKIFTPFYTTRPLGEGVGLGLYTSKKIVHSEGGAIYFSSNQDSTSFVVALPIRT